MASLTIQSQVTEGKLSDMARQAIQTTLKGLEGKIVRIIISSPKRSNNQNSYWFLMLDKHVLPQFRENGGNWSTFKLHEMLMHELGYEDTYVKPDGSIYASRQESKKFSTTEWEEFMERARAHLATEYGIYVPLPNEQI